MKPGGEHVTVVGAGYVGLVTAVGLAGAGHRVLLVEKGRDRLAALESGRVPIFEAGLQGAFDRAVAAGLLTVTPAPERGLGIVLVSAADGSVFRDGRAPVVAAVLVPVDGAPRGGVHLAGMATINRPELRPKAVRGSKVLRQPDSVS